MMAKVAQVFDEQSNRNTVHNLPRGIGPPRNLDEPWERLRDGEMPPMMFQLRFADGTMLSYAYHDLREIRYRDAGYLQILVCPLRQLLITMEGRNLTELANLLSSALVRWIVEANPRGPERPEHAPEIVRLTVEEIED